MKKQSIGVFGKRLACDMVAVRFVSASRMKTDINWFRLADGEEPVVGGQVVLREADELAAVARDGIAGPCFTALSGRIPAGTIVDINNPAGRQDDPAHAPLSLHDPDAFLTTMDS